MASEQPIVAGVAGRYATALFDLALEEKALDKVRADLDRFDELVASSADLNRLVRSPVFTADEQVKAREMVVEVDHARAGRMKALGHPIKFSDTPGEVKRPAPLLGEHTREVLRELGYADARIDALVAEGAVAAV